MHNRKSFCQILLLVLITAGLGGCYLFKKKKKDTYTLIQRGSTIFNRLDDNESARLTFKTNELAFCQIKVWTQEPNLEPTATTPIIHNCSNQNPQKTFVELIRPLRLDTLYVLEISAWPAAKTPQQADRLKVFENGNKGLGRELMVLRLNLPLKVAELHRYTRDKAIELAELKTHLRDETGCFPGYRRDADPLSKATGYDEKHIESRGFATSEAQPHRHFKERRKLYYNNFRPQDRWQWLVGPDGSVQSFIAKQGHGHFEVELKNRQTIRFQRPSLDRSENLLQLDNSQPLSLSWTAGATSEFSSVIFQIGHPNQGGEFYCVFNAADGQAIIPTDNFLTKLKPQESYDITVSFKTMQLQIFPSSNKAAWLLANYDWRTARIQL